MILNELVKSFLRQPEDTSDKDSSAVDPYNVLMDLTNNDLYPNTGAFFDTDNFHSGLFGSSDISDIVFKQKDKIMKYRAVDIIIIDAEPTVAVPVSLSCGQLKRIVSSVVVCYVD